MRRHIVMVALAMLASIGAGAVRARPRWTRRAKKRRHARSMIARSPSIPTSSAPARRAMR